MSAPRVCSHFLQTYFRIPTSTLRKVSKSPAEKAIASKSPSFFPTSPQWHTYADAWSDGHLARYLYAPRLDGVDPALGYGRAATLHAMFFAPVLIGLLRCGFRRLAVGFALLAAAAIMETSSLSAKTALTASLLVLVAVRILVRGLVRVARIRASAVVRAASIARDLLPQQTNRDTIVAEARAIVRPLPYRW